MSNLVIGDTADGKSLKLDVDLLIPSRLLIQANSGGVRARGFEENLRFLRSNELITVNRGAAKRADWIQ